MNQKSYGIATPSFISSTKSYSLKAPVRTPKAKMYGLSLAVIAPFIDNKKDYPIKMPASSRLPGYVDEEAQVLADLPAVVFSTALNKFSVDGWRRDEKGAVIHEGDYASTEVSQHLADISALSGFGRLESIKHVLLSTSELSAHNMVTMIDLLSPDLGYMVNESELRLLETARSVLSRERFVVVPVPDSETTGNRQMTYSSDIASNQDAMRLIEILNGSGYAEYIRAQVSRQEKYVSLLTYELADFVYALIETRLEEFIDVATNAFVAYIPQLISASAPRPEFTSGIDEVDMLTRNRLETHSTLDLIELFNRLSRTLLASEQELSDGAHNMTYESGFIYTFDEITASQRKFDGSIAEIYSSERSGHLIAARGSITSDISASRTRGVLSASIGVDDSGTKLNSYESNVQSFFNFSTDSRWYESITVENDEFGRDGTPIISSLEEVEASTYSSTNDKELHLEYMSQGISQSTTFDVSLSEFIGFTGSAFATYLPKLVESSKRLVTYAQEIDKLDESERENNGLYTSSVTLESFDKYAKELVSLVASLFEASNDRPIDSIINVSQSGKLIERSFVSTIDEFIDSPDKRAFEAVVASILHGALVDVSYDSVVHASDMSRRFDSHRADISTVSQFNRSREGLLIDVNSLETSSRVSEVSALISQVDGMSRVESLAVIEKIDEAIRMMTYILKLDEYEPVDGPLNLEYTWLWHSRPSWWSGWNWHKTK